MKQSHIHWEGREGLEFPLVVISHKRKNGEDINSQTGLFFLHTNEALGIPSEY